MHKGIILITPASNVKDAEERVKVFMEDYCEDNENAINPVWDWLEVGGRWKGLLNGKNSAPIKECKAVIKDWRKSTEEYVKEYEADITEWEENEKIKPGRYDMRDYYKNQIKVIKTDVLTRDSNVYLIKTEVNIIDKELFPNGFTDNKGTHNITDSLLESLISSKEILDDYYAVMVDIHH